MSRFLIKRNDELPILIWGIYYFLDGVKTAYDLSDVSEVLFNMKEVGATALKIDGKEASVHSATDGQVKYEFAAEDTDEEGEFYGEFEITMTSGKKLSVPSRKENLVIEITEDLDNG